MHWRKNGETRRKTPRVEPTMKGQEGSETLPKCISLATTMTTMTTATTMDNAPAVYWRAICQSRECNTMVALICGYVENPSRPSSVALSGITGDKSSGSLTHTLRRDYTHARLSVSVRIDSFASREHTYAWANIVCNEMDFTDTF